MVYGVNHITTSVILKKYIYLFLHQYLISLLLNQ